MLGAMNQIASQGGPQAQHARRRFSAHRAQWFAGATRYLASAKPQTIGHHPAGGDVGTSDRTTPLLASAQDRPQHAAQVHFSGAGGGRVVHSQTSQHRA